MDHGESSYRRYLAGDNEGLHEIVSADAEISDEISLDGRRGFCIMEGNTCTLYWFEGNECFCISGADYDKRCLLEIARCFVPAEQQE